MIAENPSEMPSTRMRFSAALPEIAAAGAGLLGLIVLAGWQFEIERLKRLMPQWVAMNPMTALGLVLAATSLLLIARAPRRPRLVIAARILAALVALYGAQRFLGVLGGPDFHLDTRLYNLNVGTGAIADSATRLNRVAPNTAILLVLLGVALLLATSSRWGARPAAKAVALLGGFIALVAMVGYFNGLSSLYRPTVLTPMALHTGFGFFLLAAGVMALRTDAPAGSLQEQDLTAVRRKVAVGFGAALFLLALVGVIANAAMQAFVTSARDTEASRRVLTAIAETARADAQARSARLAYDVTDEPLYLEACQAATGQLQAQLAELDSATADEAAQHARVQMLRPLIEQEILSLNTTGAPVAAEGAPDSTSAARANVARERSSARQVADRLDALRTAELRVQNQRLQETGHSYDTTLAIITGGIALAFALVGSAGWVICRDLSHKQRVAEELRIARQEAEAANYAKGAFLANMSHEIRTPMAAIIGYADLVLDPTQSSADRAEYVNTIRRNGEHLLRIINDILDLSKIDAGKMEVERTEFCPCQILSDVASVMRVRAAEKRLKLDIRNEGAIPAVIRSDPARLRQILINLLGNAVKFTQDGWVRLIMKLDESGADPMLQFDVVDTGIGMTGEELSRLFQPFVQADVSTTRRFGGTGLGLTICKRLAQMLGGRIDVDSTPGRGSTFTLRIDPGPLAGVRRLQNCREALAGVDKAQTPTTLPAFKARVLLVDDGEDNRRLLSVYLSQAGAEVTLAENGRIGVDLAQAAAAQGKPFDVMLLDMQMPVLDGYAAAAMLRTNGQTLPIIALTANAMAEDCDKCLNVGCTDYLSKPVRREKLLMTVARHLPPAAFPAAESRPSPAVNPAGAPPAGDVIRSELTDESLRHLLNAYLSELPRRVAELEASLAHHDLARLSAEIHNLKGSGGLYGLMPITDAAAEIEDALQQHLPIETLNRQVRELITLIGRVEGVGAAADAAGAGESRA